MNHVTWEVMICEGLITCSFTEKWGMWRWDKPDVKVSTWPTPLIKATKGSRNTCNSPQYGVTGCSYSTRLALCSDKHSNTRSPKNEVCHLATFNYTPSLNPCPTSPQEWGQLPYIQLLSILFRCLQTYQTFSHSNIKTNKDKNKLVYFPTATSVFRILSI